MPEGIGRVHPDSVDHLPAEVGQDMKQVVDNHAVGTVLFHLKVEGRVLIHGNSSYSSLLLWRK